MRRTITLAAVVFGAAGPAFAQTGGGSGDGEWAVKAEATVVVSGVRADDPLDPAADGPLGSALLEISRSDTFDNGLTLGWLGSVRLERDNPNRPAFIGALGGCSATNPACPSVASGALSPISPATGLSAGGAPLDDDGFVVVEAAAVSLMGPWGEGIVGYDVGAASRLDARAPTVLNRVSAFSPGLDPTGLGTTRARNDVTASSAKASYLSPRWLGLRLGVSYTPDANTRSADFDPDFSANGLASAELENVWEGAVSFARQFAEQDLRVRAAVTYASADSGASQPEFGGYEAWGAGLELEHDGWTGGVRWLSSNNAWVAGNGDYEAWEVGLVKEVDGWRFGAEAGWSEDSLTGLEGNSWLAGVSRDISHNVSLGVAWTAADADIPVPVGPSFGHRNASNDGLLLELTVRN
ncbi:MAG: porin [Hyphomonadaceae bacterium]